MKTKKMTIVKGKGTKHEKHIQTNINLFWSEVLKKWVTIPNE